VRRSTGSHRKVRRSTGSHRKVRRSTGSHRKVRLRMDSRCLVRRRMDSHRKVRSRMDSHRKVRSRMDSRCQVRSCMDSLKGSHSKRRFRDHRRGGMRRLDSHLRSRLCTIVEGRVLRVLCRCMENRSRNWVYSRRASRVHRRGKQLVGHLLGIPAPDMVPRPSRSIRRVRRQWDRRTRVHLVGWCRNRSRLQRAWESQAAKLLRTRRLLRAVPSASRQPDQ